MTRYCLIAIAPVAVAGAAEAPRFEKDVLPILTKYCFTCHGQSSPKLGLDLRTASSTLKGSHNGPVILKGKPDESLLWKKVSARQMPPAIYGQRVPDADLDTIRGWIHGGALFDAPIGDPARNAAQQRARFEQELQPIFQARCVGCHGGDQPAAGLSLKAMSDVLKGGTNGPVIIEGFSGRSLLVRRVSSGTMPPTGAGKPLTEQEVRAIREWIDRGNFAEFVAMDSAERPFTALEAPPITTAQRRFWAFQKPAAAALPKVKAKSRVRTPVDNFVLAGLESKGLSYSQDAPDVKLMRRAFLDLTGLPPSPEQVGEFVSDTRPGAFERLLDRLLESPHYGEKWGRQWLDAAGYVDTTGKDFLATKAEYAQGMWRYRDYVIRSFNSDKPWDRFLTEQIAGDELIDWRNASRFTPEIIELLTATGYLRTILDITEEDISNLPVERYEALFKLVEKVSSSTLGLTVGCARCHSHKFDPISQRDYYRFLALFTTSYNPTDWLQPQNRHLYTVSKADKEEIDRYNKELDAPIEELRKRIAALRKPYESRLFDEKLKALPEAIRSDVRSAIETPADKRDDVQKYLFTKFNNDLKITPKDTEKLLSEGDKGAIAKLDAEVAAVEAKKKKLEKIQALWDVGTPPSIRLLQRGNADAPGPRVKAGFFEILTAARPSDAVKPKETQGATSGTRLAFAQWLTHPDHPLTARVIVNRIWQGHFGTGIVATPDNFGSTGSAPTNQELLDYLAADFMKNGWKTKRLHRLIMTSTVYRQSTQQRGQPWLEKARTMDPGNALLWRMNLRRLDAESLRDSIMSASGKLDGTAGGPPIELEMRNDGLQVVSSKEPESAKWRRSVYVTSRRTYPLSFLGVFDYPIIDTNCTRRVPSATPLQSLTLLNDDFVWNSAAALAERAGGDVERVYLITLARKPTPEERDLAATYLRSNSFKSFAQALLSSNEFLYVD
jgi:cytochrome c5